MAAPEPTHLFEQADRLIEAAAIGAPRQVDLRRAISAAYYGVFHAVTAAASDLIMTAAKRRSPLYAVVYRSIEHRTIRGLCEDVVKPVLPARYNSYVPAAGFGPDITALSAAFVDLQKKRQSADYDPVPKFGRSDATLAVNIARAAVTRFAAADQEPRETFLTLLVFPPRSQ